MGPFEDETQTVLIVDDDPLNLKVIVEFLKAYGYILLIARDGETGIDRARRGHPDLILLDIMMPGMGGLEVCRRLRLDPLTRDTPVIFMTGQARTEDKLQGFEAGCVDYVTKPIEERELLARVQAHLKIKLQQAHLERYVVMLEERLSDKSAVVEQERARRESLGKEVDALRARLDAQSEQLVQMTGLWMKQRIGRADPPEELNASGLDLMKLHLKQAQGWLMSMSKDAIEAAHRHTLIALELSETLDKVRTTPAPDLPAQTGESPFDTLSSREREIVTLLVSGHSNKEIAFGLGIAATTVSTYRKRIMERLDINDLPALVRLALEHGVTS